jgi:hypothetical protein
LNIAKARFVMAKFRNVPAYKIISIILSSLACKAIHSGFQPNLFRL